MAFRRHTLLPPDDRLCALQASIPRLTRSSPHRCLQRQGISRLPETEGDKATRKAFKARPIGFFLIDMAEVQTAEGRLCLFAATDRTSKLALAQPALRATVKRFHHDSHDQPRDTSATPSPPVSRAAASAFVGAHPTGPSAEARLASPAASPAIRADKCRE